MAGVALALAIAGPAQGQGKSQARKNKAPSASSIPGPTTAVSAVPGTAPFAWIDDATLLPGGNVAWSLAALHWRGADISETDAPIVGVVAGVGRRLQLGASFPRVVGSDASGLEPGLGTSFLTAKVG